jgi:hypothetical protein
MSSQRVRISFEVLEPARTNFLGAALGAEP